MDSIKSCFSTFDHRFECLNGQKFVPKSDFLTGSAANLVSSLTAVCTISGWFNETVGSYACTQNCGPPTNYSSVMTNNWNGNTTVHWGTTYR